MTYILSVFLLCTFTGCAFDIVHINQVPVQYENVRIAKPDFELKDDVNFTLGTGYRRKINKRTRWHYVNTISQGAIFRTNDQIITIEGSNIYEAFMVVAGKELVGFYLPVEETYSPLSSPKPLSMKSITQ